MLCCIPMKFVIFMMKIYYNHNESVVFDLLIHTSILKNAKNQVMQQSHIERFLSNLLKIYGEHPVSTKMVILDIYRPVNS